MYVVHCTHIHTLKKMNELKLRQVVFSIEIRIELFSGTVADKKKNQVLLY